MLDFFDDEEKLRKKACVLWKRISDKWRESDDVIRAVPRLSLLLLDTSSRNQIQHMSRLIVISWICLNNELVCPRG